MRKLAVARGIPNITTASAAKAALRGIEAVKTHGFSVRPLQEYYKLLKGGVGGSGFSGGASGSTKPTDKPPARREVAGKA